MSYEQDQYHKSVVKELMSIRKNLEIMAKSVATQEKAERIKLGLSSLSEEFPEYKEKIAEDLSIGDQRDDAIIAVDFDGTLCENKWPDIGEPFYPVIEYLKERQARGARLILWTNRHGEPLDEAVYWCAKQGLVLNAVNDNLPDIIKAFGGNCRKIFANEYLDDRAVLPQMICKEAQS